MAGLNGVLSFLGKAASELAPQLIPGAGPLIGLAHSLTAAFETAKHMNGGTAPPDAQAAHDALFAKVTAHAQSTFSRLEGDGS